MEPRGPRNPPSALLRSPSLRIESNPLESGSLSASKKNENLAGAVLISKIELDGILKLLKIMRYARTSFGLSI